MNWIERKVNNHYSHYNAKKYWKLKFKLQNKKTNKLIKYYAMLKLKKMDAFNNASLGHRIDGGSYFQEEPFFPHGIKGIFIAERAKIGKKVTIFQQVTIGVKDFANNNLCGPEIGDNVFIGAGVKIIGNIKIGNNVKIGANCVVFQDIPDNATVVLDKPRIIIKEGSNND